MTFNWGHKLILVFLVFSGGMSYLVYRCIHTNYDLVSAEYYKDELAYQQVIDGAEKARQLSSVVSVTQTSTGIVIRFPREMKKDAVSGVAWFYYASDARRDKKIPLAIDAEGIQDIRREHFLPGHYIVKLSWDSGNQHYYAEQPFTIQ